MQLNLTDPVYVPKEQYNFVERFFLKLIRDERDLPFVWLSLRILFIIIPLSVLMFFYFRWWIALPLMALNLATGLGPYILMLHNTSHRKLYKEEYSALNYLIPWVLGPFYGETPETYFGHHIMMHHAENNQIDDLSCTMNYQRDSFIDFLKYFFIFFFFGMSDLTFYFKRKNRWKFVRKVLLGEIGFIVMCILLWQFNWAATLTVFIIPFIVARFGMMAGNWAQHAFIDASDPESPYKNSLTCINTGYNRTCFNDGYHIGHHVRPNMHWTDMPGELQKNIEKYKQNNAIIFQGIDFFVVWFLLVTKSYKTLASKYVDIREEFTTQEEIIAMLKTRIARFEMKRVHVNANVVFNRIN
ncbi:MAG: fatty acid desaturase [Chitinophagales bacterium]